LYQLREASQGEDIYLDVDAFLKGKDKNTKAYHHLLERVGLQESSPQNNFRRIISCRISKEQFCNHTINYTTERHSKLRLELVLFVLNSAFAEWYFRLGSTNAHVSHYQLKNLPCPRFMNNPKNADELTIKPVQLLLAERKFSVLEEQVLSRAANDGPSPVVEQMIVDIVRFIEQQELLRGQISRTARSRLSEDGQSCQSILDKLMLSLIGISSDKAQFIDDRLSMML
jgi:hypothetical protein